MYLTIRIANETIPWVTKLSKITGMMNTDGMVAALDQGGSPITYVYTQLFQRGNLSAAFVIAGVYIVCYVSAVFWMKRGKGELQKEGEGENEKAVFDGN